MILFKGSVVSSCCSSQRAETFILRVKKHLLDSLISSYSRTSPRLRFACLLFFYHFCGTMFKLALIAASCLATTAFAAVVTPTNLKPLLQQSSNQWSSDTQIYYPSDPNYASLTTQRWDIYEAPTYVASIKPGSEKDVQKIVRIFIYFFRCQLSETPQNN